MADPKSNERVRVDGKFFRLGEQKFYVKGVAYGPFALSAEKDHFPSAALAKADFQLIRELGANVIRTYYPPPRWFLDLAAEHELKILVDIPWEKNRCFLDSEKTKQAAREVVRRVVHEGAGHAAIFAYSIVNEIASDIVRWSGARAVENFLDELIAVAKEADPGCLCTFSNYPPTEFLHPRTIDFLSFNVYLHQRKVYENYLYRLQMLAEKKPLLISEFGIDSLREGEEAKCEILSWQVETTFRAGLAGTVVFSFTDDWVVAGEPIADWAMGLTTPERTLKACLDSLSRQNYPDYEVILVDDGSLDASGQIASLYTNIRYFRQSNKGLSAARNAGIAAATGEIIAFTDADCRADEDWVHFLISDLLSGDFAGAG